MFTSLSLCWADAGDVTNETDRKMWEICRRLNGDESYKFPSEDNQEMRWIFHCIWTNYDDSI